MKLQKNTSLALFSVLEFAGAPLRHVPAAEIADKYGVSPHHLAKVLAVLARAGVVESVRGVGGGYRFAGNARRLTLLDIVEMFEELGPMEPVASRESPVERALDTVLGEIDANARATLGSITLATMLRLVERQQSASSPTPASARRRRAASRVAFSAARAAARRAPRARSCRDCRADRRRRSCSSRGSGCPCGGARSRRARAALRGTRACRSSRR